MIIKKFFHTLSMFHYDKIFKYSQKLNIHILIDVGSHQGEFITRFIKHKKIKKLFCFEPNIKLFKVLKDNYKKNNKIVLFDFALGEKNTKKKLYLSNLSYNSTLSSFNKKSNYLKFKNIILRDQKKKFDTIKQRKFDDIFKKIDIKNSFLKLDVEGYEINVLRGLRKKIKDIKYILIEHQFSSQYTNNFNENKKFLVKNNFEIIKVFYFPTLHYRDILFINKSYNSEKI